MVYFDQFSVQLLYTPCGVSSDGDVVHYIVIEKFHFEF